MLKKLHKLCYSLILTLPTLVQAATDCSAVTQIPSTECEALVTLYNSTNGDGWKYNSEWLETNTPCSWERVSCTSGHVSELYLHSNQLTGTIPSELGNLSYLEYLYLHSNQLTGTIPSELGNLSKLTRLYLSSNQLTGTIPSELGNLSKLTKLNLSDNKLTGSIPSNLPSGTLNVLNLSDNRLTGTIPTLSGLIALTEINLSQNLLTGSFPDRLNSLAGLKTLLLNDNGLCGEIPTNLIDSTASPVSPITQLQLENNHLTANDATLRQWLMNLNPTWESSQTLCTAGTLQFSSAKDSIGESDGSISITVSRVESNAGDVSVMYISEDVTATGAGVDYATVAGILTWTDKASNDQIVTVNITDDSINEDEETFKLKLLNAIGGATIGEPATAEVTIIDDDDEEGTLQFSSATYNVNETGGTITVTVKRINDKEGAISVTYTSSDDTAMAWNDYTPTAGTLNWNNGDTSDKTFTVSITDDAIFEGDETFNLTLSNATGGATIGEPSTAVVTIIDDEKPPKGTLQFSSATYNVNETGGTITIPVKRINSKEGDISVMYVTDNGTATAGNDYTPTIGTLNWNNGDTSDKTFTVTIIDDAIFEGDETFKLMLSNATGGATIGEPSTAVVTIIDNESVLLQFSEAEYEIKENVESVIFPIRRTGESDGAVSIDYATSDDTAKAGIDYTETTGTCSWDGGDNSDCEDFQVSINNDDESEDNETFIVSIGNPTGGAQTGTPDTATVMIVDNDTAFNCKKVTSIPKKECQALVAFYDNTDGDNWENSEGWFETNTPCSWNGVTCSGEHVSELSLPGNELTGKFPKKLNKLNKLEKLDLSYNSLTGKIPDLGKMKNLTELALDHNELEGEIPKQLGNLKNLTGLALSVNILDGKIPKELSNLKKLEWLLLDHNMLDSNIPKELGDLTNLKRLDLDYNHFTESIPDELGKLTKLKRLSLANNQLTGSIPKALGNLEELKFLALWRNQLTGEIPSELSNLSKLETLELQYNQLTGTIPGELGDLSRLSYIQLRDNELRGEIPTELKELLIPVKPNPVYLKLDNNHLTATDEELIDWLDEHNPDWETTQRFPKLQLEPTLIEDTLRETITLKNTGEEPLTYNLLLTRETIEPSVTSVLTDIGIEYAPNEIIIKRANNTTLTLRESVNATLKQNIPQLNLEVWTLPVQADILNTIQILTADPNIEYAEPNYIQKANSNLNDEYFDELWGMYNTGQTGGTTDADIDAPEAWETFTGSHNITVAVIDSGMDYNHEDLKNNRWTNLGEIPDNNIDDDGNGYIDDVYGYDFAYDDGDPMDVFSHGTHCAGTIGAEGNNRIGVVGVNHTVRIMAAKFLGDDAGSGNTVHAIQAIIYAVDNGAQILNNSWGGGAYSQALKEAIQYANQHDVLFVAVAGNGYGNDNDKKPFYPSSYQVPNVLAVAATDHEDGLAGFSNYGLKNVDLGAPGADILSTMPGNQYDTKDGTSMATPLVSGAAALLKGYNPSLSAVEQKRIIMESVDPIDSLYGKTVTGGRLNLEKALKQAGTSWITIEGEMSGTIEPGELAEVTVQLDVTGLTPGEHTAIIKVITNDPRTNHQEVLIILNVPR